ncbi:MAG: hypothetical protein GKS05_00645 [Nitrospirales bacterium]|nr:hypothetical protein [Nitrospirales bacterium]
MKCGCGQPLEWREVEEIDTRTCLGRCACPSCFSRFAVEAEPALFSSLLTGILWTDLASHELERLPPYVEPLVRHDVEQYVTQKGVFLVSWAMMNEAKHQGMVSWNPEAEKRLAKVPAGIRAMARVELERTALDRDLSEVTVSLMEEVKARYFGMGRG